MSSSVQSAPATVVPNVIGDGFFTPESVPDEIHLADLNLDDSLREVQFFVVDLESHLYRAQRAANQLFQSSMNRKESQIRDLFHILVEETRAASSMQNHSMTEINGNSLENHQSKYISKVEKNTDEAFLNLFESVFSIIRCPNSEICWQTHGISILSLATTYSEITMRRDPKYWVQAPFSMLWPKGRTGKLVPSVPTLSLIYLQQHLPTTDKRPLQLYEALLTQMETNFIPAQPVFDLFNELSMWIKVVVDNYWAAELLHAKTRCCEKGCLGGTPFDWNTHLNEQYFETITTLEKFTVSAAALRWVTNTNQNQSSVFDQIKVRVRGRLFRKDFSLVTWRTYVLHQKSYHEAEKEYERLSNQKSSGAVSEKEVLALIDAFTNLCSVLQAVGVECSVLTKLGMIYWKLLDDETQARDYFTQALDKIDDPQFEKYKKCESVVEARRNLSLLTRAYEKKKKRQLAEDLEREEQQLREEVSRMEEKRRREEEIRKFREEEEERRKNQQERQREEQRQREEERQQEERQRQMEEERQRQMEEEIRKTEEERKRRNEEQAAEELRKRTQDEKRRQMEEAIRRFEKEMEDRKRKEKEEQRQQEEIRRAADADRRRRWEAEEQRRKVQEKLQKEEQRRDAEQRTKDYEERRRKREQNSTRRSSGAEKLFRQADQRRRDTSTNLNTFTVKAREIYGMASLMALLRWLYDTFTPIDPIVAVRLHNLLRGECVSANDFRSIIFIYHPDKNCRHGELWKYLCQEVTKVLTQIREEKKHLFE